MVKSVKDKNLSKVALENSSYSFILTLILKFGGLIFTVLIARILLPELFGIYSLALSIATIAVSFTDLGVDSTFLRYFSEALGKRNKQKARSYFRYLLRIKLFLITTLIILLLIFSKFISYNIYNKPLLLFAIIFSCLFIIMESLTTFFGNILLAAKNLKPLPLLVTLNQIIKILLSIFAISLVKYEFKVPSLFIAFAISGGIYLFLMFLIAYKKEKEYLIGSKTNIDKKSVNNYLKFMAISSLSLAFFGSVDILMLGKFVAVEYLGYYRVSLSLILTIASLFSLSSVFIPIFTQINDERFKRGFHKTLRYILLLSIPATAGIIFIGKYLIKAIYSNSYILAASSMYFLSLLILTTPLIGLYSMIFQSKEKPKLVSNSVLISLIINIVLNIFVIFLFKNNPLFMIAGIGLATSLSRIFLLGILVLHAKKEFNFRVKGIGLRAPIFATVIMSLFLLIFNKLVNMNIFLGIIEVIIGTSIYLVSLILLKGVNKEDWNIIRSLFKK
jgi:O-antigen/teichoic acid export membrane protein